MKMNKNKKKLLALATVGFLTFSSTSAFAEENNGLGLEIVDDTAVTENSPESDLNSHTGNGESSETVEQNLESPSLLPGDFFYFVKTALEKIKLAFTYDNEEEAKLLATYAAERLAEAEALFANGEEDKALETINNALSYLNDAGDLADEGKEEGELATEEETEDTDSVGENAEVIEEDTPSKDEDATDSEESTVTEPDENATVEDSLDDIEELISQNIIALKAALEKVKNPVAKAALQKNIEKSYAKLAKKLEKLEEKYTDKDESSIAPDPDIPVEMKDEEDGDLTVVTPDASTTPIVTDEVKQSVENSTEEKAVIEDIKKQQKASVKEVKQEMKEVKKQVKSEEKQLKKEEQQVKHQQKQAEKQAKKEEKSTEKRQEKKEDKKENSKGTQKEQKNNGKDK